MYPDAIEGVTYRDDPIPIPDLIEELNVLQSTRSFPTRSFPGPSRFAPIMRSASGVCSRLPCMLRTSNRSTAVSARARLSVIANRRICRTGCGLPVAHTNNLYYRQWMSYRHYA